MRVPRRRPGARLALTPYAWSLASILAALIAPWLGSGAAAALSTSERLQRGLYVLGALALAIAAISVGSSAPTLARFVTALGAWLLVVVVAGLAWLAPSLARGVRRVRSESFRASLSRVMQLPRWYVVPAAVVGCAAEDALGRAGRFVVVESRTGAAWLAAGLAAIIELALHGAPRSAWSFTSGLLAAGVAAGMMRWHARLDAPAAP